MKTLQQIEELSKHIYMSTEVGNAVEWSERIRQKVATAIAATTFIQGSAENAKMHLIYDINWNSDPRNLTFNILNKMQPIGYDEKTVCNLWELLSQ